jgi:hypothetical protein
MISKLESREQNQTANNQTMWYWCSRRLLSGIGIKGLWIGGSGKCASWCGLCMIDNRYVIFRSLITSTTEVPEQGYPAHFTIMLVVSHVAF